MKNQKVLVFANTIALVISIIWMIKSNFDYEPIIVTITFIITLFSLFFYDKSNSEKNDKKTPFSKNYINAKGNKSKLNLSSKFIADGENSNIVIIEGDENEIDQKIE